MPKAEDLSVHDPWIDAVCTALDLPRDAVDVDVVLALAGQVAHCVARPMAPVSTFMLGLALGRGTGSATELRQRILDVPGQ